MANSVDPDQMQRFAVLLQPCKRSRHLNNSGLRFWYNLLYRLKIIGPSSLLFIIIIISSSSSRSSSRSSGSSSICNYCFCYCW